MILRKERILVIKVCGVAAPKVVKQSRASNFVWSDLCEFALTIWEKKGTQVRSWWSLERGKGWQRSSSMLTPQQRHRFLCGTELRQTNLVPHVHSPSLFAFAFPLLSNTCFVHLFFGKIEKDLSKNSESELPIFLHLRKSSNHAERYRRVSNSPIWRWNNMGKNKEKRQGSQSKCTREKESIEVAGTHLGSLGFLMQNFLLAFRSKILEMVKERQQICSLLFLANWKMIDLRIIFSSIGEPLTCSLPFYSIYQSQITIYYYQLPGHTIIHYHYCQLLSLDRQDMTWWRRGAAIAPVLQQ